MNRREFIKILSASAMAPVIGLPAVAPGAPAVEFTSAELAKIAEECLEELEEKEPFRDYFESRAFITFRGVRFYYNERLPA